MFKKLFSWIQSLFWKKEIEISIVGLQNAGKSTLVNSMSTGKFDQETVPTIGMNYRSMKKGSVAMKLWDLGGQPRYRESWEKYCSTSDVIIYVVDASERESIDVARTQLHELLSWETLAGIPLLVLGNKNDMKDALNEEELIELLELKKLSNRKVCCYSISAKNMVNLDITMKWIQDQPKIKR
jgi:ADP-ribosylation factor-like protein 8